MSGDGNGDRVATAWPITNCTMPADGLDNPIESFDDATTLEAAGWTLEGAFASPASADAWRATTASSGFGAWVGDGSVSTCELGGGCDGPTGSLTSPTLTVSHDYIGLMMAGGNGSAPVGIQVLDTSGDVLAQYLPNSCGPSYVDGDDDWVALNVSEYMGQDIQVRIFDEEAGGCGFVSFDHLYWTNDPYGPEVAFAYDTTNCSLTSDAITSVIADFDDPTTIDTTQWTLTGDFATLSSADAWVGTTTDGAAARVGARAVSTCELEGLGCDGPTGTITSPAITVTGNYVSMLMAGGNGGGAQVGMEIRDTSGTVLASYTPNSCGPSYIDGDADWVHVDVSAFVGSDIVLHIYDNESGGCGFISFDHVYQSDTGRGTLVATAAR